MSTSLADASESRKQRLLALRQRKEQGPQDENGPDGVPFVFKPRNYDPETRTLKKRDANQEEEDTVEKDVAGLAEMIIAEDEEKRAQELDLLNIVPKRANWDLKRNMERKLAKLERKTQESIHTLIRQRLAAQKGEKGGDDLAASIKAQEQAAMKEDEDEDAADRLSDED